MGHHKTQAEVIVRIPNFRNDSNISNRKDQSPELKMKSIQVYQIHTQSWTQCPLPITSLTNEGQEPNSSMKQEAQNYILYLSLRLKSTKARRLCSALTKEGLSFLLKQIIIKSVRMRKPCCSYCLRTDSWEKNWSQRMRVWTNWSSMQRNDNENHWKSVNSSSNRLIWMKWRRWT